MKLTDEKMNEMILDHWDNSNPLDFNRRDFRDGIKKARYFYENQVCGTCNRNADNDGSCIVDIKGGSHEPENFGCNQWEPRK